MAETADIGRRAYYLEWGKLIFGSAWFGWMVAAAITVVHFNVPAQVRSFLPGKTDVANAPIALSPTVEELHDRIIRMEGDVKLVADWVAAQQMRIPGRAKAK